MVDVKKIDDNTFVVAVKDTTETKHEVTVEPTYWQELTGGSVSMQTLVERSFEFLLEREPNTSILPAFTLSSINRYFPEYGEEIKKRL